MHEVIIPFIVYIIPSFVLLCMAVKVLYRNPTKTEHRLLSLYIFCYANLFLEEYIRHLLPLEYSPALVTYWFGNVGVLMPCLFFHFIAKFSTYDRKIPAYFYPYIFYMPLLPVIFTIVFQKNIMNSQYFYQFGLWKYPEFNTPYLITLTAGNLFHLLILTLLWYIRSQKRLSGHKKILTLLLNSAAFVLIWDIIFGYFNFQGIIPPYPYIFGGLIWIAALSYATQKYDFLSSYNKRFETLYNLNPAAILLVNQKGFISDCNPAAHKLLQTCALKKQQFHQLISTDDQEEWMLFYSRQFATEDKFSKYETKIQTPSNGERFILIEGDFVLIENEPHFILIIQDIHDYKEAEKAIRFLAYHDSLTKLPNRRYFYEHIQLPRDQKVAILVIDLDEFKAINDRYGHQTGDDYLVHFSQLLMQHTRQEGVASRVGGDEFYVYLPYSDLIFVHEFTQQLLVSFKEHPFKTEHQSLPIQSSIGISLYPEHGTDLDTLIHRADEAMYQIKHTGKNGYKIGVRPPAR
ncbi:diguanylate cyclase (GGDEF)-like protein/PAS domain S-box-containing protein [Bacillus ectoiniformans]|uniref:sensor domain-containing diguanylate cyclase n=1 Tax=Bacillus ectoiniformans TaxID=1494429 RepID=UPI00195A5138|nr:sensor domain-containing diguanylate cyclase [Bacillus ectoiniformans]MBM7648206.1 diguanylate cyclase (GGDEF)-like protein/PAS domain S-box-containing protein [Bacillus ectoiniformans]